MWLGTETGPEMGPGSLGDQEPRRPNALSRTLRSAPIRLKLPFCENPLKTAACLGLEFPCLLHFRFRISRFKFRIFSADGVKQPARSGGGALPVIISIIRSSRNPRLPGYRNYNL